MSNFKKLCENLEADIERSYKDGITLDEAEKLAGKFLHAQLLTSVQLSARDLDTRMRKSGLKAVKAAIYMDAATKGDKKPTEAALASILDMNEIVQGEQKAFDMAEVEKAELERYYDIFLNAHIYYRGVAKGNFNG